MTTERNPIGWFEIYVQDMERAKKFYEAVFQRELKELPNPNPDQGDLQMLAFPPMDGSEKPGCGGALAKMKGKESGGGGTIVYFSCEDCAEEASRVVPNGGTIYFDKMSIGEYGFIAMVVDPDGNVIGLHSTK